ncbi:MAG TPA: fumarylacetoacetate hydrolase family protein [Blastocatellia bacterium]
MEEQERNSLAEKLYSAFSNAEPMDTPPSSQFESLQIAEAYQIAEMAAQIKSHAGHSPAGRKVGFANKALWRILKLDTLVWGYVWDDTIRYVQAADSLPLGKVYSPRIEPEVVMKLNGRLDAGATDGPSALVAVEWMALAFEINDCIFPDWKFKPVDFVATLGFHKLLAVGELVYITTDNIGPLAEQLAGFKLKLYKNGELAAEGAGKNSLRSPALCLLELSRVLAAQPGAVGLAPGEIISTGTLTDALPVAAGQQWTADVEGIELPSLSVKFD